MGKTIRNGLAIAEVINDDKALANEVAINLSDEALKVIVQKRTGVELSQNEHTTFNEALHLLLKS